MSEAPPVRIVAGISIHPTGAGVRVAIVDSGVDASHPWLSSAPIKHAKVVQNGEAFAVSAVGQGEDGSGHGTACAGIIHRMVPEADIVSVRALGPEGRCSREALLAALRYCVRERFAVVNLSLGIDIPRAIPLKATDYKSIVELYEIADAAYTAGVVLVASGPNVASFRTYPGRFKSLIGVGRAAFSDPEGLRTHLTQDYEILGHGNDVLAPSLDGGERRWTGTSFACPSVAAHVARIRAARSGLTVEAIKAALHGLAKAYDPKESAHAPA